MGRDAAKLNMDRFIQWLFAFYCAIALVTLLFVLFVKNNVKESSSSPLIFVSVSRSQEWKSGFASYYDYDLSGPDQRCLTDDCYSRYNATTASREFPRGTMILVRNPKNQKEVVVKVNDYGPAECPRSEPDCYLKGRALDLSSYAFKQLTALSKGVLWVEYKVIEG